MLYFAPDHAQRENFHQGRDDKAYRYLGAHPVHTLEGDCWQVKELEV